MWMAKLLRHLFGKARVTAGHTTGVCHAVWQPTLGLLQFVHPEEGDLTGNHPRQRLQGVDGPLLVGDHGNTLERRMVTYQRLETQFEVLRQPAGAEALIRGRDDLDDAHLAALQHFLHGRLEVAQVLAAGPAGYREPRHALGHVRQHFDHRTVLSSTWRSAPLVTELSLTGVHCRKTGDPGARAVDPHTSCENA